MQSIKICRTKDDFNLQNTELCLELSLSHFALCKNSNAKPGTRNNCSDHLTPSYVQNFSLAKYCVENSKYQTFVCSLACHRRFNTLSCYRVVALLLVATLKTV